MSTKSKIRNKKEAAQIMTRAKTPDKPISPEGCWIRCQLGLRNIKYEDVAKKARRTAAFVSMVIGGKRRSERVEAALAEMLGYPSWKPLWADAFTYAERRTL